MATKDGEFVSTNEEQTPLEEIANVPTLDNPYSVQPVGGESHLAMSAWDRLAGRFAD